MRQQQDSHVIRPRELGSDADPEGQARRRNCVVGLARETEGKLGMLARRSGNKVAQNEREGRRAPGQAKPWRSAQ